MSRVRAALTGDIVKSSRRPPRDLDRVRRAVGAAATEIGRWRRGLVPAQPEFFRGDAWQMILDDPALALRSALYLRATLRARGLPDTRIAIGIGPVTRLNTKRVSLSTGAALTASGQALDKLGPSSRLAVAVGAGLPLHAGAPAILAQLCGALADGWRPRQAEIVRLAIAPPGATHTEIGSRLDPPITKQAVAKSLTASGWQAIDATLDWFESLVWRQP